MRQLPHHPRALVTVIASAVAFLVLTGGLGAVLAVRAQPDASAVEVVAGEAPLTGFELASASPPASPDAPAEAPPTEGAPDEAPAPDDVAPPAPPADEVAGAAVPSVPAEVVAEEVEEAQEAEAELVRPPGVPDDSYWERMARCETGGNWAMTGSRYSGGVGFYNGTWDAWGGREFASLAGLATREQQIEVANRVATQGYEGPRGYVAPVGYSGWGCVRSIGYP